MTIFGRDNPKLGSEIYGICLPRAGLYLANPCLPTRWNQMSVGFQGLWVLGVWVKSALTVHYLKIYCEPERYDSTNET